MDREIKFRGKQLNGEWAYGDLLRIGGGCIIYIGSKTETQTPDIPKESEVAVELFDNDIAIVIPDTVGQFTGLTDCNGNEIYEGDILSTDLAKSSCEVVFRNGCFALRLNDGEEDFYDILAPLEDSVAQTKYHAIIGNIHDNPELIPNQPTAI